VASPEIADEERRLALARVLESRTFSRSEQLRAFLRYVCEAEFAGRAHELNEYALGVSVLKRRPGYSPAEDSGVRSRAYELRNKLRTYYDDEAPDDPVQIEIEKGAYVPRFRRREKVAEKSAAEKTTDGALSRDLPPEPAPSRTNRFAARWGVAALAAGIVLTMVSGVLWWGSRVKPIDAGLAPQAATREMKALWKPFLDPSIPLLISFEIRLFFFAPAAGLVVRDYRTNQAAEATQSKPLATFQDRMGDPPLSENFDYADFGAVHAVFLLGRLLNREVGLKHSRDLGWEDISNNSIVFIGKPNVNPTIRQLLQRADFVDDDLGVVRNVRPRPGEPTAYRSASTHGSGTKYAVISVFPGPQPGRHMMILTGSGAELMWALAQSVTDPTRVREIMSHVLSPAGECPAAFQVVIEARFESNVPVQVRYLTHRILPPG
jgi:hypothetical protein